METETRSNESTTTWSKSLEALPIFTIREIEAHRQASGKQNPVMKTTDRGKQFHEEGYLNEIFTSFTTTEFYVKAKCKASMKKDIRSVHIILNRATSQVQNGECSCPAGNSGYCNHVMALLFRLAEYTLKQLVDIPEEIACTSQPRKWGIPNSSRGQTKKNQLWKA